MIYDDFLDNQVCFLLTVDWMGKPFRFSTIVLDVKDTITNQTYTYEGGLSDPDFSQSTSFTGVNVEGNNINLELVFNGVDWVAEWLQGRTLSQSDCTLSMIPTSNMKTTYTEQDKILLYTGKVTDPIIGTPDKPKGHVVFSMSNDTTVSSRKIMDSSFEIQVYNFPGLDQRAAAIGRMIQYPVGKYAPLVFGTPGTYPVRVNNTGIEFINKAQVSPVYTIDTTGSGIGLTAVYIIAYHPVKASTVRVWDQSGGNFKNTIRTALDTDGNLYSYTTYTLGGVIEDNSYVPALDEDQTFWASWDEDSGGYPAPYSTGSMSGAGDICLFILESLGLSYDRGAWMGLLNNLNLYRFAGYINDPNVLAWDWLQENILQWLPIEVVQGPLGLTPKMHLYFFSSKLEPQFHILESGQFEVVTGIQPLDITTVNKITCKFCYQGQFDTYATSVTIDPTIPSSKQNPLLLQDNIAAVSYQKYGLKEEIIECPFVWDLDTAIRIAKDRIKVRALGPVGIEIKAFPRYGYLDIGDIISFTSTTLGLEKHLCQVISKSWSDNQWSFVLYLEDSTINRIR